MKHVQSNRVAHVEVRAAKEAGQIALVLTPEGLHSDVYLLTETEWAAVVGAAVALKKKASKGK